MRSDPKQNSEITAYIIDTRVHAHAGVVWRTVQGRVVRVRTHRNAHGTRELVIRDTRGNADITVTWGNCLGLRMEDEGVRWCRGWTGPAADALAVAFALSPPISV